MPVIDEIGKAIEVISAAMTLYFTLREKISGPHGDELERHLREYIRRSGIKIPKSVMGRLDRAVRKTIDAISKQQSRK
jgi:hypothetical protein